MAEQAQKGTNREPEEPEARALRDGETEAARRTDVSDIRNELAQLRQLLAAHPAFSSPDAPRGEHPGPR